MTTFSVNAFGTILAVSHFADSLAFYTDLLEFEVLEVFAEPDFAILGRGEARLCLAAEGVAAEDRPGVDLYAPPDRSRLQVNLVLWVDDCWAAYRALLGRGVPFLGEPTSPPWGGARCFAVDPDGYLVEIEELA